MRALPESRPATCGTSRGRRTSSPWAVPATTPSSAPRTRASSRRPPRSAGSSADLGGLLVVGAERANALGAYDVSDPQSPRYVQTLPSGIGPEGVKAVDNRRLLVVANEVSIDDAVPSLITIYRTAPRAADAYPQLGSADSSAGTPIPWVAMSGLVGDPTDADVLYGVSDSFLAHGFIYTIDVSRTPAVITDRVQVTAPDGQPFFPDLEGIAVAPEGGFWLASEGRTGARPNALLRTDNAGVVEHSVELPDGLTAARPTAASRGSPSRPATAPPVRVRRHPAGVGRRRRQRRQDRPVRRRERHLGLRELREGAAGGRRVGRSVRDQPVARRHVRDHRA